MPNLTEFPSSVSFVLSLWGALLSTILAAIKIAEFKRGKADLKITLKGGMMLVTPAAKMYPHHKAQMRILIKAANQSRRPVTIDCANAGIMIPWSSKYMNLNPFSQDGPQIITLEEGKSHCYYIDEDQFKKHFKGNLGLCIAYVHDQAGRSYYSKGLVKRLLLGRPR